MTLPVVDRLDVFKDGRLVGALHNEQPLAFAYADTWLAAPAGIAIDPELPVVPGKIASPRVAAFFENLLPEGEQRRLIGLRYHVSSVFGMLQAVGGDTAGALVLLPAGQVPQAARYRPLSWQQIDQLLHADGSELADPEDTAGADLFSRVSISGAQLKMLISLDEDGNPLQPLGTTPSTHILKPDMLRQHIKLFATAMNETLVMRAASLCGLPVAEVAYQPQARACLVTRFDRGRNADGALQRLWQCDFCQLAGTPSESKYEVDGGPGFRQCFELLGTHSSRPAVDQRHLLRWLFFNLYVGNNDSHAKNLAMLADHGGLRLAPFYDLLSTRVYSGLAQHFAFRIGGESLPGAMNSSHLVLLAEELGVAAKYLKKIALEMAARVQIAMPQAVQSLLPGLPHAERIMAGRIEQKVMSISKKMQARLLPATS